MNNASLNLSMLGMGDEVLHLKFIDFLDENKKLISVKI